MVTPAGNALGSGRVQGLPRSPALALPSEEVPCREDLLFLTRALGIWASPFLGEAPGLLPDGPFDSRPSSPAFLSSLEHRPLVLGPGPWRQGGDSPPKATNIICPCPHPTCPPPGQAPVPRLTQASTWSPG